MRNISQCFSGAGGKLTGRGSRTWRNYIGIYEEGQPGLRATKAISVVTVIPSAAEKCCTKQGSFPTNQTMPFSRDLHRVDRYRAVWLVGKTPA